MKIVIFGATGMVGQGVLREALLAGQVSEVLTVGRSPSGLSHPKLRELVLPNLLDYSAVQAELSGVDACWYCLGASAVGLDEAACTRINYDLPLAAGQALARLNPQLRWVYVSGAGAGTSQAMWAQVRRRTEAGLLALPLAAVSIFRPGIIQPLHGIRSKTRLYHLFYVAAAPLLTAFRKWFPNQVLSTEEIGRAMLQASLHGAPKSILESADIRALLTAAGTASPP